MDVVPTAPNVGDSLFYPSNWKTFPGSPTDIQVAHDYFVEVIEVDNNSNSIIHWGFVKVP